MKLRPKSQPSLGDLETKRADVVAKLVDLDAESQRLDPLDDLIKLSEIAAQRSAYQNALAHLDATIQQARQVELDAQREAQDQAIHQRRLQAVADLRVQTKAILDVLGHFDQVVLRSFDDACAEFSATGDILPAATAQVLTLRRQVSATLATVKSFDPEMLNLPPLPGAKDVAISEARGDLARAEATLAEIAKAPYSSSDARSRSLGQAETWVRSAQGRLTALTGESFALDNLALRVNRLLSFPPARQPESETQP